MSSALALELLGVPVLLASDDGDVAARLELCYARSRTTPGLPGATAFAAAEGPAAVAFAASGKPAAVTGSVQRDARGFRVEVEGRDALLESDASAAVRALNHELLQALMLRCRAHYFVHAAVLVHHGRAIVLPGLSRAGKSTLGLALVLAGARFLSDELLCYTHAGRAVALPRAFKIRDECVRYFPELAREFVGTGEGRFLPFSALPADVVAPPAPVGALVVPCWSSGAADVPVAITRGEALLALAASSLNFGAHRAVSLDWLAQMVDEVPTFALDWSDPRAAARALLARPELSRTRAGGAELER